MTYRVEEVVGRTVFLRQEGDKARLRRVYLRRAGLSKGSIVEIVGKHIFIVAHPQNIKGAVHA